MTSRIFGADWLVTICGRPHRKAVVVVEGNRIAWVGPYADLPPQWRFIDVDWRSGVLTPGLVNAHTHLQYSDFDALGRGQYRDFEHWSEAFEVAYMAVADPSAWSDAAARGVKLALSTGTTVFSEIITNDQARGAIGASEATGIEYLEVIGEIDRSWNAGGHAAFLERLCQPATIPTGISPHAPYSIDPCVVTDLVEIARKQGMRLHTHLGESSAEQALYLSGDPTVLTIYGDLRDEYHLVRRGGAGLETAAYADSLGLLAETTHIAHGVYFDHCQRELLRSNGTQVALCPRSNAVIGLDQAPVAAYLREGHDIAVGTDSLASCPSLDLMGDVKLLAVIAREQGYDGEDLYVRLMQAATVGGARALGMAEKGYGTIVVGGPADFAVFDIDVAGENVERALVEHAEGRCVLTVAGGAVAHDIRQEGSASSRPAFGSR